MEFGRIRILSSLLPPAISPVLFSIVRSIQWLKREKINNLETELIIKHRPLLLSTSTYIGDELDFEWALSTTFSRRRVSAQRRSRLCIKNIWVVKMESSSITKQKTQLNLWDDRSILQFTISIHSQLLSLCSLFLTSITVASSSSFFPLFNSINNFSIFLALLGFFI